MVNRPAYCATELQAIVIPMPKKQSSTRVVIAPPVDAGVEAFRAYMGSLADRYTDAQLRQLQREMYAMAEILLELYMIRRKGNQPTIRF